MCDALFDDTQPKFDQAFIEQWLAKFENILPDSYDDLDNKYQYKQFMRYFCACDNLKSYKRLISNEAAILPYIQEYQSAKSQIERYRWLYRHRYTLEQLHANYISEFLSIRACDWTGKYDDCLRNLNDRVDRSLFKNAAILLKMTEMTYDVLVEDTDDVPDPYPTSMLGYKLPKLYKQMYRAHYA